MLAAPVFEEDGLVERFAPVFGPPDPPHAGRHNAQISSRLATKTRRFGIPDFSHITTASVMSLYI
jgi:hypothetical protein